MLYQSDQIVNPSVIPVRSGIDSINHRESYTSQITLTLLKEEEQTGILLVKQQTGILLVKQQTGILLVKSVFDPVSPLTSGLKMISLLSTELHTQVISVRSDC